MIRSNTRNLTFSAVISLMIVGCHGGKMDMESMQPPPRAAELNQLDAFVGQWEGTSEIKMGGSDEVTKSKGVSTCAWDCDKRVLVSHDTFEMGEMGTMTGIGVWTWDAKAKKYRTWWFGSDGGFSQGTATYDSAKSTWRMKGKSSHGTGVGTVTIKDNNHHDWTWTEYGPLRLYKIMEMKGSGKRK